MTDALQVRKNRLITCETGSTRRHADGWTGRERRAERCRPAGGVTFVGVAYGTLPSVGVACETVPCVGVAYNRVPSVGVAANTVQSMGVVYGTVPSVGVAYETQQT